MNYQVIVSDAEDGRIGDGIAESDVVVTKHYLQSGYDETEIIRGHLAPTQFIAGKQLIEASDCKACHKMDIKSIGPSYLQVAERYKDNPNAVSYLSGKILKGGGGVWGDQAMAAHPQLSNEEAEEMVKYILSLGTEVLNQLPVSGSFLPNEHLEDAIKGRYFLKATYTDRGNGEVPSLSTTTTRSFKFHFLSPMKVSVEHENDIDIKDVSGFEEPDELKGWEDFEDEVLEEAELVGNGSVVTFGEFDLKGVRSVTVGGFVLGPGCNLELLIDGQFAGMGVYDSTGSPRVLEGVFDGEGSITVNGEFGKAIVAIKITNANPGKPAAAILGYIRFDKE